MKLCRIMLVAAVLFFLSSSISVAGDFDWMHDFNIQAQADPSGFKARLATRFQIGSAQIDAIIGNVSNPVDAYMVMRLGEMSNHQPEYVMKKYKAGKKKGWGALAKSLGIKPGSPEFHALKRGEDLYGCGGGKYSGEKGRGNGRGKSKNKG
ncbi:hypothetical exported protein [Syntrophus aciditrophicus SB]|uniref:Hypothetical exported protein n=2 Tax=Syntrophus TaxID=43773 RepID=Q2LS76_SYNAS|nr:hypothetical exported protein [Syntrophus aciditrophicus SB]OPY17439.1 MAG: hypothetical protein A4E74_01267 [Syntrophus sp. PtaB.Bin075]